VVMKQRTVAMSGCTMPEPLPCHRPCRSPHPPSPGAARCFGTVSVVAIARLKSSPG
jgi:hypothetical protein